MSQVIDDFINGNLTDAKRRAAKVSAISLIRNMQNDYGYSAEKAIAVAAYLKGEGSFQAACDAE
jgi:hypothetical protein